MKFAMSYSCGKDSTLVVDGPIFRRPLPFKTGELLDFGEYSVIDVWSE